MWTSKNVIQVNVIHKRSKYLRVYIHYYLNIMYKYSLYTDLAIHSSFQRKAVTKINVPNVLLLIFLFVNSP